MGGNAKPVSWALKSVTGSGSNRSESENFSRWALVPIAINRLAVLIPASKAISALVVASRFSNAMVSGAATQVFAAAPIGRG